MAELLRHARRTPGLGAGGIRPVGHEIKRAQPDAEVDRVAVRADRRNEVAQDGACSYRNFPRTAPAACGPRGTGPAGSRGSA